MLSDAAVLRNFLLIARLAVHDLGSVGCVGSLKFIRTCLIPMKMAGFAHAGTVPKLKWRAFREPLVMATVGAKRRNRQLHALIEIKLRGNSLKCRRTLFFASTSMSTRNNIILDFVVAHFRIFPPKTLLYCFFFGKWEVILRNRFIIGKWRKVGRKKFTIFSGRGHLSYDFSNERLVFFF